MTLHNILSVQLVHNRDIDAKQSISLRLPHYVSNVAQYMYMRSV